MLVCPRHVKDYGTRVVLFGLEKVEVARGDPGLIVIVPLADRAHQPDERMSHNNGVDV